MNIKNILKESIGFALNEKLAVGTYKFTFKDVKIDKNAETGKMYLRYIGTVPNSKGAEQATAISENIDGEKGLSFALTRLIKLFLHFNISTPEALMEYNELDELVALANTELIGKTMQMTVQEKRVSGKIFVDKEFVF